jgi:hypothetical protein
MPKMPKFSALFTDSAQQQDFLFPESLMDFTERSWPGAAVATGFISTDSSILITIA